MSVTWTSASRMCTASCRAVWAAAFVGKPALLVCIRLPVLSRPYSSMHRQEPLTSVRREGAVRVARAGPGVALRDGAVFHRCTWTSSSSGALGMRMSLPSRSTGVGHLPRRMSS